MIDCSLDTSVLIDLARGRHGADAIVSQFTHSSISHVVLGELLLGGYKAERPNETLAILEALKGIEILKADAQTAVVYAEIRFRLEEQGNVIPQNDLWIAAASIQADVPLITRDQHFRRIAQLKLLEY